MTQHAQQALSAQGAELQPPHGACHICALDGCDDPVYFDGNVVHDYCNKSHADLALELGQRTESNRTRQNNSTRENRSRDSALFSPTLLSRACLTDAITLALGDR